MNLFETYHEEVKQGNIVDDANQRLILSHLQRLVTVLSQPTPWYARWQRKTISGVYICGPVGMGKTYLMDLFYHAIPETRKARFHFHHFMQQVDQQLRLLQGRANPLMHIAQKLSKKTRVLCLDEFLVDDVAYAMILAELLTALFKYNVILVATANTRPDDLYLNGVGRERFLPAIALLKTNCDVVELEDHRDYRLGRAPLSQAYLCPLNQASETALTAQFETIAKQKPQHGYLEIQQRQIPVIGLGAAVVWFEFDIICNLPRCQLDYIEIANRFNTVIVSNISVLTIEDTVKAILLIHLVDVFYDRGIRLIISAAVPANALYVAGEKQNEFARTLSRLEEMQSADYLSRHDPSQQIHSEIV